MIVSTYPIISYLQHGNLYYITTHQETFLDPNNHAE
jgi:hypothetical protein